MSQSLISTAQQKINIILHPVKVVNNWCVLCSNSGGKARYWAIRGDDDEVYVWKLSKRELLELEDKTHGQW